MTKEQLDAYMISTLEDTVDKLLLANNQVTTLEVKNELRLTVPNIMWTQEYVSAQMNEFYINKKLTYVDNGTHRIYCFNIPKKELTKKEKKKLKKQKLSDLLNDLYYDVLTPEQEVTISEIAKLLKIEII